MPVTPMKFSDREDLSPLCPYCERYLDEVYVKREGISGGGGPVLFCPFCLRLLAILAPSAKD